MNKLLMKEIRLSSSKLSFVFLAFGLMTLLPGYPILCGAFFICLGIFQSWQYAREAGDISYSVLLPVAKRDVVRGKYRFAVLIELMGFSVMTVCTVLRMTLLADSAVYRSNVLMNANPFFLAMALLIFGLFNAIFIGGFFRTAYRFSRPFVMFLIAAFAVLAVGETLHHLPRLSLMNAFGFEHWPLQLMLLLSGNVCFLLLTIFSCKRSMKRFEALDL